MLIGESVVQAISQHAVVDLGIAHTVPPTPAEHQVGRSVHILHAAGNRAIHHAEHDFLGGRDDRLSTGATHAVHRHGGHFDRQSAKDGGLSRRIYLVAGLYDIAHNDGLNLGGVKLSSRQNRDHCRPYRRCRRIFQRAPKVPMAVRTGEVITTLL